MKAVRFHGSKDVRFEDVLAPTQVGPAQVLIRNELCGICGTDLHEYLDGPHWTPKGRNPYSGAQLPQILGHEFAGEVIEVGKDVTGVRAGDRVSVQPQIGPSTDYFGRQGLFHFSPLSATIGLSWPWGGMSELSVVNQYNAFRMPDGLSFAQGAMIEPAAVAVQAIDRGGVKTGDRVLVAGGGPIGALVAMAADAAGASAIIISETSPGRRARLEALSVAKHILDPRADDFVQRVKAETTENLGVDVAIECSGNPAALQQCIDLVRPLGTVVVTGVVHGGAKLDPFQWLVKGINIHAMLCYPTDVWPRVMAMVESGKFPVEKLIDATIGGEAVVDAGFKPLLDPKSSLLKIMVKPN